MARLIVILWGCALFATAADANAGPVVVAAIGAAVSTGVAAAVGTAFTWAAFGQAFAVNLALSVLGGLLADSPSQPSGGGFSAEARGRQVVIRSATEPHRIVYGEVSVAGPLVFAHVSGGNNEYLHLVVPVAGHEVDGIPYVYLNDERIGTLDTDGNCISGTFAGHVRVHKYLGTDTQDADAALIAESGGLWTTAHRGLGLAYVYVRLKFNDGIFPNGIPNVRAIVRGRKCYDPRDGGTRWTPNWELQVRDYLAADFGLACDAAELDDTIVISGANICDERVVVDGGSPRYSVTFTVDTGTDTIAFTNPEKRFDTGDGVAAYSTGALPTGIAGSPNQFFFIRTGPTTGKLASTYANAIAGTAIDISSVGTGTHSLQHVDQARYTGNGTISLGDTPESIIRALLSAAVGAVVYQQGTYKIYPAAYRAPTMDLDENCLNGGLIIKPHLPRADLYNGVRGTYVDPALNWQSTDFPPVTNATYETQDGGEQVLRDVEFPFTTNNIRAQRMAKIILERSRQSITVQMPCNMSVLKLAPWDTVRLTNSIAGWTNKVFMVLGWRFGAHGGVDLQLQEEASAVYDWALGDATTVDPAPDTNLPGADTIRRAIPPDMKGLQIVGDDPTTTLFTGRDVKLVCRRSALYAAFGLGSEQFGAGDGYDDFFFKDFQWEVYDVNGTLLRTDYTADAGYVYPYEKNSQDNNGVPMRTGTIKGRLRTQYNQVSAIPAQLTFNNAVPVKPAAGTVTGKINGFTIVAPRPTEADVLAGGGMQVCASSISGFTPGAANLLYDGPDFQAEITGQAPSTTLYVRFAYYDTFGKSGLRFSDEQSVTTLQVQTVDIVTEGATKLVSSSSSGTLAQEAYVTGSPTGNGNAYCPVLKSLSFTVNASTPGSPLITAQVEATRGSDGASAATEHFGVLSFSSSSAPVTVSGLTFTPNEVDARIDVTGTGLTSKTGFFYLGDGYPLVYIYQVNSDVSAYAMCVDISSYGAFRTNVLYGLPSRSPFAGDVTYLGFSANGNVKVPELLRQIPTTSGGSLGALTIVGNGSGFGYGGPYQTLFFVGPDNVPTVTPSVGVAHTFKNRTLSAFFSKR